jgi:phosphoenolpyruvate synthase/pyruvate phosphate dikinase
MAANSGSLDNGLRLAPRSVPRRTSEIKLDENREEALVSKKEQPMADNKKCGHPNCTCTVSDGKKYCSPQCEAMKTTPDVDCKCGHPGCRGRAS